MKDLEGRGRSYDRRLATTTDRAARREIRQIRANLIQELRLIDADLRRACLYVIRTTLHFWSDALLETVATFLDVETEP